MGIRSDAEEILSHVYGLYDSGAPIDILYDVIEWNPDRIHRAFAYLKDKEYVNWDSDSEPSITTKGIDFVEDKLCPEKKIQKISSHKIRIGPYEYKWEIKGK